MKDKKKCPVCLEMFEPMPCRKYTCGRPCQILQQKRRSVNTLRERLAIAEKELIDIEQRWKEGRLPKGRGKI